MNKKLAAEAKRGLTASGYETVAGYCQRFTRQCVQKALGHKYDRYFKESAYLTMKAFEKSPYAVKPDMSRPDKGTQVGDILYKGRKTSGRHGHVGIRILGNKIAENSSSHIDPSSGDDDARGTRSIDAFGPFELIVRLTE